MPRLETSSVEQREPFIADERRGLYTRSELCARYGIGRKTGYRRFDRFEADGRRGLRYKHQVDAPPVRDPQAFTLWRI